MNSDWKRPFFIGVVLSLGLALHAEEKCPVEVKVLLSAQTTHTVIASLKFEKETTGRVYFFDTDDLGLLKQGVIVRVRQGANTDITVKVRAPAGDTLVDVAQLRERFPCEVNRTGAGEDTDYAVRNKYKGPLVPEIGGGISNLLSPSQNRLLREAGAAIDWSQVKRIANIKATGWETTAQSPFRKLTLELWEWPTGNILELSTKVAREAANIFGVATVGGPEGPVGERRPRWKDGHRFEEANESTNASELISFEVPVLRLVDGLVIAVVRQLHHG